MIFKQKIFNPVYIKGKNAAEWYDSKVLSLCKSISGNKILPLNAQ